MNRLNIALLIAVIGVGCSGRAAKNDFADFSFAMSKEDYESKGFVCNQKDGDYRFECTNLDWSGSVMGKAVKRARVGLSDEKGRSYIAVDFSSPPRSMYEIVETHTAIDQMYARVKDKDIVSELGVIAVWSRPDGSTLKMNFSVGTAGVIPPKANFYVFDAK